MSEVQDFIIDQGADFGCDVLWSAAGVPVNLTGATARMDLKALITDVSPALSLTVGDGLTITALSGKVSVAIDAAASAALVSTSYVYDLKITFPDTTVRKLIRGTFTVNLGVTP